MNWRVMAKKDFLDAHRKWSLGTAAVGFVLFLAVPMYLGMSHARNPGTVDFFGQMGILVFFAPLAGLMMSYGAIAAERELGSLKLLLALPYTRRDVIAGKAVGRAAVVGTATFVGVFAATVIFLAFGGSLPVVEYVAFLVLVFLLTAAYTSSAVCLSAASPTSNRAMATSVGFFLLTFLGWSSVPLVIRYVLNGFSSPRGAPPAWANVIDSLSPVKAYSTGMDTLVHGNAGSTFYHTGWFAFLVLVAWAVIPVVLGYRRFSSVDI
ncbi:ABC transporter [Haladaptatus sp. W1]|uniref:ABC transporter permease subunit n=1 Tax=Haladaptatus sp. W1 TaxID=1897478 RepID=UPI000849AD91|nr:ABC transporter permease subunit [Haladaptatus sp. W1]ODR83117.1 ABC transporter [Haladaptatus sp. W1]